MRCHLPRGLGRAFSYLALTTSPSVAPGPTPNPLEAAYELVADFEYRLGDGSAYTDLEPPANTLCVGDNLSQLRLNYEGLSCTSSNTTGRSYAGATSNGSISGQPLVFVSVTNRNNPLYFSGFVPLGGQFIVDGGAGLDDLISIRIRTSTVDVTTGQAGQLLQAIQMRATCQEGRDDITLLTQYGAFQLFSFTSVNHGTNSAVVDIILSYSVTNAGRLIAFAELVQRMTMVQGDSTPFSRSGVQLARGITRSFQDIS
jgi:hypothetical protein